MVLSVRGNLLPPNTPTPILDTLRWRAAISIDGKITKLGTHASEREAALRYDHVARSMGKPTNFKLDGTPGNAKKLPPINPEKRSKYTGVAWHSGTQR
jgi:hypothetical protein